MELPPPDLYVSVVHVFHDCNLDKKKKKTISLSIFSFKTNQNPIQNVAKKKGI